MGSFWQYFLIFLLVAIEGAGVTLAGAALAGVGTLDPIWVFLAASAGNLTGDLCWYLLGYHGQIDKLLRWFPRLASLEPQIERFKLHVSRKAAPMLFSTKLLFGIGSIPTLIAAGVTRCSLWRIAPAQIVGELIWTGTLVLIGLFLGQYVTQFAKSIQIIGIVGGLVLMLGILWLVRRQVTASTQISQ